MDLASCMKLVPNGNSDYGDNLYGFDRFYQSLKASIKSTRETRACVAELVDAYYMFSRRLQQIAVKLTRANQVNCLAGTVQSAWQQLADAARDDGVVHGKFANDVNVSVVQPLTEILQELVSTYKPIKREVTRANAVHQETLASQMASKKEAFSLAKRFYEAAATHSASPRVEATMRKREAHYVETCCETERARAAYYLSVQQAICRIDKLQERRAEALRSAADKYDRSLAACYDVTPAIHERLRAAVDHIDVAQDIKRLRTAASATKRAPDERPNESEPAEIENADADNSTLLRETSETDAFDCILDSCNTQLLVEFYAEEQNNVVYGDANLREAALSRKRDELSVEVQRFSQQASSLHDQFVSFYKTAQTQPEQSEKLASSANTIGLIRRTPSGRFIADDGSQAAGLRGADGGVTPLQRDHARQQVLVVARRWFELESVLLMLTASLWKLQGTKVPNADEAHPAAFRRPIATAAAFGDSSLRDFISRERDAHGLWQTSLRLPMRVFVDHLPTEIAVIFRHDSLFAVAAAESRAQTHARGSILHGAASFLATARASIRLHTGRSVRMTQRPSDWTPSAPPSRPQAPVLPAQEPEESYANVPFSAAQRRQPEAQPAVSSSRPIIKPVAMADIDVEEAYDSDEAASEPYMNVVLKRPDPVPKPEYAQPRDTLAPSADSTPLAHVHEPPQSSQNEPEHPPQQPSVQRRRSVDSVEQRIMNAADADFDAEHESLDDDFFTDDDDIAEDPVAKQPDSDEKRRSKKLADDPAKDSGAYKALVVSSTPIRVELAQQTTTVSDSKSGPRSPTQAESEADTSQRSNLSATSANRPAAPPRPKEIPAHVRARLDRKNADTVNAK